MMTAALPERRRGPVCFVGVNYPAKLSHASEVSAQKRSTPGFGPSVQQKQTTVERPIRDSSVRAKSLRQEPGTSKLTLASDGVTLLQWQ